MYIIVSISCTNTPEHLYHSLLFDIIINGLMVQKMNKCTA